MPRIQVLQCWDDGVVDDIRLTELLRSFQAKASFNLNPGLHEASRSGQSLHKGIKKVQRLAYSELTSVYEGFTIANHCFTHPHPLQLTLADWRNRVADGRKALQDLFQQEVAGFAYPYGEHDSQTELVVREAGHSYARTCEFSAVCHPSANRYAQPTNCHFRDPNFWQHYETAKNNGSSVFYFWGHSYEMITESDWKEFADRLRKIDSDPDSAWSDLPQALAR